MSNRTARKARNPFRFQGGGDVAYPDIQTGEPPSGSAWENPPKAAYDFITAPPRPYRAPDVTPGDSKEALNVPPSVSPKTNEVPPPPPPPARVEDMPSSGNLGPQSTSDQYRQFTSPHRMGPDQSDTSGLVYATDPKEAAAQQGATPPAAASSRQPDFRNTLNPDRPSMQVPDNYAHMSPAFKFFTVLREGTAGLGNIQKLQQGALDLENHRQSFDDAYKNKSIYNDQMAIEGLNGEVTK